MREIVGEAAYAAIRPHVGRALSGKRSPSTYIGASARLHPVGFGPFTCRSESPNGEVDGFVALILDISVQKQADAAREALVSNLERTVAFSERFVGILGHDLRNPLFAIHTAGLVLGQRATTTGDLKTSQQIIGSAERMSRMIDQLLDFTRTRIGSGIPLSPTKSDLATICRSAVDELEPRAPQRRSPSTGGATPPEPGIRSPRPGLLEHRRQRARSRRGQRRLDSPGRNRRRRRGHRSAQRRRDSRRSVVDDLRSLPAAHPNRPARRPWTGSLHRRSIVHAHGGRIEASTPDATTLFRIVIPRNAPSAAHVFAERLPDRSPPA